MRNRGFEPNWKRSGMFARLYKKIDAYRVRTRSGMRVEFGGKPDAYRAGSPHGRKWYDAASQKGKWRCVCPYHTKGRNRFCGHTLAAQDAPVAAMRGPARERKPEPPVTSDPDLTCTGCGGTDCRFKETRENRYGASKRYVCRPCGKTFTHRPGMLGCRHSEDDVIGAMDDTTGGMSPTEASGRVDGPDGRKPGAKTVGRWMGKHGGTRWKLSDMVARNRVREDWATDGVHCKVDGGEARMFGLMDTESRFIIVFDRAPKKRGYDAKPLLGRAVDAAGLVPRTRIADGPDTLPAAVAALKDFAPHIRDAGVRKSHADNNPCGRFNGTLRDAIGRARGFRVFHPARLALFMPYYNLFRPHSALDGASPAEHLGLEIGTKTGSMKEEMKMALRYAALHCQ